MSFVALAFSLALAALGAVGVVSPPRLLGIVERFQSQSGIYAATAIRVAVGFALFLAAPASRAPGAIELLGIIVIAAGLITPWVGLERFRRLLGWWSAQGTGFVRAWGAAALVFGLLVAYALAY
jgi:hypothetical protein